MDGTRVGQGETIAALSAAALSLFMLFDWFGYDQEGDFDLGGFNAWQWMSFLDIVLFLTIIVTIGIVFARATDSLPANLPAQPAQILAGACALALVIVLFRLLFPGDGPGIDPTGLADTSRKIGVFLGLIAAGGMAYGAFRALNEAGPSTAQPPRRRRTPEPPPP